MDYNGKRLLLYCTRVLLYTLGLSGQESATVALLYLVVLLYGTLRVHWYATVQNAVVLPVIQ